MFKTIFSKMVAIFMLILITAFTIAGVALNFFLRDYFTNQKAEILEASCDDINTLFGSYLEYQDNLFAERIFNNALDTYRGSSIVWIVSKTGYIYKSRPTSIDRVLEKYKDKNGYKLPDPRQYAKVMTSPGAVTEVGDFYGFFKDEAFGSLQNASWLTVEKSFPYTDPNGNDTLVGIYMHTPVPEVQETRDAVFRYFFISVAVAVFISVILIYIFSLKFSKPLKQIKNAAKIISSGEFSKRLNIKGNDEIGELARTFNSMAAALQNLEEMRRGFIANVSHELRTPMTSIRGFIQGILDGTIPEEKQSYYLNVVSDETNRLNRLVNNLLDLARMEAGEVKMNFRPFDINELVRRSVIKLETLLLEKNIMVEADFEEETAGVNADIDAIERVVYNLLHNAIKFSPEGGKITISVKPQRDRIQVSVADSGSGIDKSELDMIWERFYKSDKSRSRDKTGTGLGLAIVKNIMNEHGQDIWVESELGKGTKFTFTLARSEKLKELPEG